jgi:predicted GIY-YIG superfamily endonuclease
MGPGGQGPRRRVNGRRVAADAAEFRKAMKAATSPSHMPFVYILRCGDDSLYTGVAKDVTRRLEQHRAGQASRYTRSHLPVRLVWVRRVRSWGAALRHEHRIKALRRAEKEALVRASGIGLGGAARRRGSGAS